MKSISLLVSMLLIASCGLASADDISVYNGQPVAQLGIALGPWGSGSADENPERSLSGGRSIRVKTEGWFSGGRIDFTEPVKLFSAEPAPNQFLVFTISPTIQSELSTSGIDMGWYNRASRRSAAAGAYDFGAETIRKATIEKLKLTFVSDGGARSDVILPVIAVDEAGWIKVGLPLVKLKSSDGASGYNLKRILVFSDVADTINIGAIHVTEDNEPIRANPGDDISFAIGDVVVFRANVTAGLSAIRASWDFNDQDGIQEDAVGEIVRYVYMKPGDYKATLTVKDVDGVKASVTHTLKVHIE